MNQRFLIRQYGLCYHFSFFPTKIGFRFFPSIYENIEWSNYLTINGIHFYFCLNVTFTSNVCAMLLLSSSWQIVCMSLKKIVYNCHANFNGAYTLQSLFVCFRSLFRSRKKKTKMFMCVYACMVGALQSVCLSGFELVFLHSNRIVNILCVFFLLWYVYRKKWNRFHWANTFFHCVYTKKNAHSHILLYVCEKKTNDESNHAKKTPKYIIRDKFKRNSITMLSKAILYREFGRIILITLVLLKWNRFTFLTHWSTKASR